LVQATLHCVGKASLKMANLDISLCFDLEVIPVLFVKQNYQPDEWSSGSLQTMGTANAFCPSCEKPHTHYITM
jgi:hypothetical protein